MGPLLALGIAAAFLKHPYGSRAGLIEVSLGFAAIGSWCWMSLNYSDWIIDIFGYTAQKYVPGFIAILLLMEACAGRPDFRSPSSSGASLPTGYSGICCRRRSRPNNCRCRGWSCTCTRDTNGVPGQVLTVVARLVLAFIVLGKLMEVSGATKFFTNLAMAAMGHQRGGAAKVAVVASSIFGSINGTSVGNIMSTGIVTIPLMKRSGFKPHYAAAIEAVASNGGQFAPPVMGATAS